MFTVEHTRWEKKSVLSKISFGSIDNGASSYKCQFAVMMQI